MVRFKVRPTRQTTLAPCAAELSTLLACFATTGDLRAAGEGAAGCAAAAKGLQLCMQKGAKGAGRRSGSINHLLSKLR
ncbi:hypothetical protein Q5752_006675 [Cryptotrichosporon argae]